MTRKYKFICYFIIALNFLVFKDGFSAEYSYTPGKDGVIIDSKNNLMWAQSDNNKDITWFEAVKYCEDFSGGGYDDWRMPTMEELATLSATQTKNDNGLYIDNLFKLSDFFLWSAEDHTCKATCLNFLTKAQYNFAKARAGAARVLPVRNLTAEKQEN